MEDKTFPFGEGGTALAVTDEVKTSPTTTCSPLPKGEGNCQLLFRFAMGLHSS